VVRISAPLNANGVTSVVFTVEAPSDGKVDLLGGLGRAGAATPARHFWAQVARPTRRRPRRWWCWSSYSVVGAGGSWADQPGTSCGRSRRRYASDRRARVDAVNGSVRASERHRYTYFYSPAPTKSRHLRTDARCRSLTRTARGAGCTNSLGRVLRHTRIDLRERQGVLVQQVPFAARLGADDGLTLCMAARRTGFGNEDGRVLRHITPRAGQLVDKPLRRSSHACYAISNKFRRAPAKVWSRSPEKS